MDQAPSTNIRTCSKHTHTHRTHTNRKKWSQNKALCKETTTTHSFQVLSEVCEEFEASVEDVLLLLGQVVHLVSL